MVGDSDSAPPASIVIGNDADSAPPASIAIGNDAVSIPQTVFSASVSTENIAFSDSSLMMPAKGKMMKKQFFLGLLFPLIVSILFAISIESLTESDYQDGTFESNEQGEFSIDLAELGWNCDDGSYYEANLNWNTNNTSIPHGSYFEAYYDCMGDLRYYTNENIGTIHENGSIELDLLYPPVDGYDVIFHYWKDGNSRTALLGQGDGVNTTFSGNVDPDYCDGDGDYRYSLGGSSNDNYGWFSTNGGPRPCSIWESGDIIIDSELEDGVLTFKLPDTHSSAKEINIKIYSGYDSSTDFIIGVLPFLGCLGFIGAGVGAYMSGYKWFAYGVGASVIVLPAVLFVVFIAALMTYGF
ncbi:MAG: hypothetical protein ABGX44_06045 [Candidatus Poseidoniia archaeon]